MVVGVLSSACTSLSSSELSEPDLIFCSAPAATAPLAAFLPFFLAFFALRNDLGCCGVDAALLLGSAASLALSGDWRASTGSVAEVCRAAGTAEAEEDRRLQLPSSDAR